MILTFDSKVLALSMLGVFIYLLRTKVLFNIPFVFLFYVCFGQEIVAEELDHNN